MKLQRYTFLLLFLFGLGFTGRAQTLPELIATGLQNNYKLKIARNEEERRANNATPANAGYLPQVSVSAGYDGGYGDVKTRQRATGVTTRQGAAVDHGLQAGVDVDWTVFDGFKIQATYARLQELKRQGSTRTRMEIEDYVATLTSEYYNLIQQQIRSRNLRHAVKLSKERLRIVLERYTIGSASRLDLQQAQVDFNADSAQSLKQNEALATSRIRLYELMAIDSLGTIPLVRDTSILVDTHLNRDTLLAATLELNAQLLDSRHDIRLAQQDYRAVMSRDYPYIKLYAGYSGGMNTYGAGANDRRTTHGADFGVKVGYTLFDGNRRRERRNAQLDIDNAELARLQLEQTLRSDLADLWQAYTNNLRLLSLERENLITARENHYIAHERYM
ncbi:MAG: TolC family protein, partial [Bacteroidaceae bacterium]|nr:TolC family protein [Bacteroidaceae bacterium]